MEPLHFVMFWTLALMENSMDLIFYIQSTLILEFLLGLGQVTLVGGGGGQREEGGMVKNAKKHCIHGGVLFYIGYTPNFKGQ